MLEALVFGYIHKYLGGILTCPLGKAKEVGSPWFISLLQPQALEQVCSTGREHLPMASVGLRSNKNQLVVVVLCVRNVLCHLTLVSLCSLGMVR